MSNSDDHKSSTMEIRLSVQRSLKENLSKQARTGLLERRSGKDRRGWGSMPSTPFTDSKGSTVSKDRRVIPERRVSSMSIDWDSQYPGQNDPESPSLPESQPAVPENLASRDEWGESEEESDSGVYSIEELQKTLEGQGVLDEELDLNSGSQGENDPEQDEKP